MKPLMMFILALLVSAAPASADRMQPVVVFAGAAAQPPLEEAVDCFERQSGIPIILHLGGSGAMLGQARLTNGGDIYIPGSPDYMEMAREQGLVVGKETVLAYLVPAILVPKGNPKEIGVLADLARPGLRVGIADPRGVCVGLYAIELLQANSLLEKVRPNLVGQVESCARAAAMLPLGTVDAVIGWREFASWSPDTMEAILPDPTQLPRLAYIPAARLAHAANPRGAEAFITFLASPQGREIFRRWGYETEEAAARNLAPLARIGGRYMLPEVW